MMQQSVAVSIDLLSPTSIAAAYNIFDLPVKPSIADVLKKSSHSISSSVHSSPNMPAKKENLWLFPLMNRYTWNVLQCANKLFIGHTPTNCHGNIPHLDNSYHKKREPSRQSRGHSKVRQEYRPKVDEMSSLPDLNIFVQDSVMVPSSMDSVLVEGTSFIPRTDPIDKWDLNDQWVSIDGSISRSISSSVQVTFDFPTTTAVISPLHDLIV
ncbi:hypothetical protein LWI29_022963 [Acer saccharum]|uniref:Uncharacterized protein n=1 Tax=Acer saccharum TaxID=4024 RepID=A0AA39STS7_ACESA|nr:hypothetical protein LWI29_022963 [Acer saccharum]